MVTATNICFIRNIYPNIKTNKLIFPIIMSIIIFHFCDIIINDGYIKAPCCSRRYSKIIERGWLCNIWKLIILSKGGRRTISIDCIDLQITLGIANKVSYYLQLTIIIIIIIIIINGIIKVEVNKCLSGFIGSGSNDDRNSPYVLRYSISMIHEVYIWDKKKFSQLHAGS